MKAWSAGSGTGKGGGGSSEPLVLVAGILDQNTFTSLNSMQIAFARILTGKSNCNLLHAASASVAGSLGRPAAASASLNAAINASAKPAGGWGTMTAGANRGSTMQLQRLLQVNRGVNYFVDSETI